MAGAIFRAYTPLAPPLPMLPLGLPPAPPPTHSMMQYFMPLVGVYVPLAVKICTLICEKAVVPLDHVPSPRQNVDADADVPEFSLVAGRFPLTPVAKLT